MARTPEKQPSQPASQPRKSGVSFKTDELSQSLLGDVLDMLAVGEEFGVVLAVQDTHGMVEYYEFSEDDLDECLDGARQFVIELAAMGGDPEVGLGTPVRYAIVYEDDVAVEEGDDFQDAVLLEFGERGYESYSGYSLIFGKGEDENFRWTELKAAGQLEPLL